LKSAVRPLRRVIIANNNDLQHMDQCQNSKHRQKQYSVNNCGRFDIVLSNWIFGRKIHRGKTPCAIWDNRPSEK
jgi:hypothetical protein